MSATTNGSASRWTFTNDDAVELTTKDFPRNDITVVWFLVIYPFISRLSSIWIIVFWVACDVLFLALGAETMVGLWAHVAGFAAGFGIAMLCATMGWIKSPDDEQTLLQIFRR